MPNPVETSDPRLEGYLEVGYPLRSEEERYSGRILLEGGTRRGQHLGCK